MNVRILGLIAAAILSCSEADRSSSSPSAGEPPSIANEVARDEPGPTLQVSDTRKIIRTASLQVVVADTEAAADEVARLARDLDGFVGHVQARRRDELLYYDVTIRVPSERFDEAIAAIRALSLRVDREAQAVEDVTDQYVDLEARLTTLRATEEELRSLLSESRQRGRDVEDIMAVYRELTQIRSQIEQLQGQMNVMERRIALSVISLELVPDAASRPIVTDEWRPVETARSAVRALVAVLKELADLSIYVVILLVPVVLVIGIPLYLLNRWLKRRRQG